MSETKQPKFQVVVAYDFTELAELALNEALVLANLQPQAAVHVIGILDPKQGMPNIGIETANADGAAAVQERLQEHVCKVVARIQPEDFYFFVHSRIGDAAGEVVGLANEIEADLIIAGTHGRTGIRRMVLGSVAEKISRHAQCPVLVMRHKGYDPGARPTIEPEPADPPGTARRFHPTIDARRFAFTRQHQVMPMRPKDWPLW